MFELGRNLYFELTPKCGNKTYIIGDVPQKQNNFNPKIYVNAFRTFIPERNSYTDKKNIKLVRFI